MSKPARAPDRLLDYFRVDRSDKREERGDDDDRLEREREREREREAVAGHEGGQQLE